MRRVVVVFVALLAASSLIACAPTTGVPATDAGSDADGGADDDADGGATKDAGGDVAVDAGTTEDEVPTGKGLIAWSEELPNPYLFPGPDDVDGVLDPIAVDFFLQYTVVMPDPNVPEATVVIERCEQRASWESEVCNEETIPAAATGGYRWGFDPSQYESGRNIYKHGLTLVQDGVPLDSTVLRFEVTAP